MTMATATLFKSFRRRSITSASLFAFESLIGAKTSGNRSYLSRKSGVFARPFITETIGIDFGTTNSRVAVVEGKNIPTSKVIRNVEGSLLTPSVVLFNHKRRYTETSKVRNAEGSISTPFVTSFNHKRELTVGTLAKHQVVTEPKNSVFGVKRLIGRRFDDVLTQKEMRMVPYNVVKGLNGDAWVEANGQKYSPTQIAAFVFADLKKTAEDYLEKTITDAIITVPGCFNEAQRKATEDAAWIAGLDVQKIINESEAAAISYAKLHNRDGLFTVFDLGGGTFDVSILRIRDSCCIECEVKAQNGDSSLGGADFDDAIVDFVISEFKRTDGVYLNNDIVALQRLREAAEKAKIELSTETQTEIDLPFITTDACGAKHLHITLTRSNFEAQVNHLIERIKSLCEKCVEEAGIRIYELDEVILVGGMSRVPIIEEVVTEIFGKAPIKAVNPYGAVAMGASYHEFNYILHEEEEEKYPSKNWENWGLVYCE